MASIVATPWAKTVVLKFECASDALRAYYTQLAWPHHQSFRFSRWKPNHFHFKQLPTWY